MHPGGKGIKGYPTRVGREVKGQERTSALGQRKGSFNAFKGN
jgi:hypothetical protein